MENYKKMSPAAVIYKTQHCQGPGKIQTMYRKIILLMAYHPWPNSLYSTNYTGNPAAHNLT